MTKLGDKPAYCCGCFQQEDVRYVDFEAAYDGPVIPGTPEPIPVDDLILCEKCLQEAFDLLDPQGLKETIRELEAEVLDLVNDVKAKDRIIKGAEATIGELVDHPIKAPSGKPPLVGVSPEVRKAITKARYERRGSSANPHQKKQKEKAAA